MDILVGCEFSGVVRDAFRARGHNAYSCDLEPSEDMTYHLQCDIFDVLYQGWDLMVAHPPCTYLSVSGLHWNKNNPERTKKTEEGLQFVQLLMDAPIEKICIENPIRCISSRIRKPDQIIQPYEFNHDASKRTSLWLKNLAPLAIDPINRFPGRKVIYNGKERERWGNQTDSGQNILGPSNHRARLRSVTYTGLAEQMSLQWSE